MLSRRNVELPPWFGQLLALGFKQVLGLELEIYVSSNMYIIDKIHKHDDDM